MFFKLLKYDVRTGIAGRLQTFIAPAILYVLAFINYLIRVDSYTRRSGASRLGRSLGDALLFIYGGMKEYDPTVERRFIFPALWMLVYLLLAYIVLYYPYRDIEETGQNILIRTGGRGGWWLSKCLWSMLTVLLYCLLGWGLTLVGCVIVRIPLTMQISPNINVLFEMSGGSLLHPEKMTVEILLLPMLAMAAICLLQMTLALFIRPVYCYMCTVAILLAGTYYMHPWLIGNYAMPLRSGRMIKNGMPAVIGCVLCTGGIVLSMAVGLARFRRYDILSRENIDD